MTLFHFSQKKYSRISIKNQTQKRHLKTTILSSSTNKQQKLNSDERKSSDDEVVEVQKNAIMLAIENKHFSKNPTGGVVLTSV